MPQLDMYVSELGWAISMPPDWRELQPAEEGYDSAVLSRIDNPAISLTWMVSQITEQAAADKFQTLTLSEGTKSPKETESLLERIFPLLGSVSKSSVLELADRSYAIETEEILSDSFGNVETKGYQLVARLNSSYHKGPVFQRLCFYAPPEQFETWLPSIREMVRSFHYVRPFGKTAT
jgi:hypothetical protein